MVWAGSLLDDFDLDLEDLYDDELLDLAWSAIVSRKPGGRALSFGGLGELSAELSAAAGGMLSTNE